MNVSSNGNPQKGSKRVDEIDAVFDRKLEKVEKSYDCFHRIVEGRFYSLTGDYHAAQDLSQEFWRKVLLKLPEKDIGQLGILLRMAYQVFVDKHWRSKVRRNEVLLDETPEPENGSSFLEPYSESEESRLRESFFSEFPSVELTGDQQEALWLHARQGMTFAEIGKRLHAGKSTVGDWIAHARRQIKHALESQKL